MPRGRRHEIPLLEIEAVRLRAEGAGYREIAAEQGVSIAGAHYRVERGLQRWAKPDIDRVFAQEMTKLDQLEASAWNQAIVDKDKDARLFILKIMERRAKMTGVDAPTKIDVTSDVEEWALREGVSPEDAIAIVQDFLQEMGTAD